MFYVACTINLIPLLDDLEDLEKGEGERFDEDSNIGPGGGLPVNTTGGGLSYCHPCMYGIFTMIEATHQLRGECGPRQQDEVNIALAHGNGGQLSSQVTAILGTASALCPGPISPQEAL